MPERADTAIPERPLAVECETCDGLGDCVICAGEDGCGVCRYTGNCQTCHGSGKPLLRNLVAALGGGWDLEPAAYSALQDAKQALGNGSREDS